MPSSSWLSLSALQWEGAACILCICVLRPAISRLVAAWLRKRLTALPELEGAGERPCRKKNLSGRAVICGGSIAGLLAARVCADHFEEVVIVEAEAWTTLPDCALAPAPETENNQAEEEEDDEQASELRARLDPRKRVAQYTSAHATQVFNFVALKKLFPDFERRLVEAGVPITSADYSLHFDGVHLAPPRFMYPEGLPKVFAATRRTYETILRRAVREHYPSVRFVAGTVTGVNADESGREIASVTYRPVDGQTNAVILECALVADCTGPACAGLKWLRRAGFIAPDASFDVNVNSVEALTQDLKQIYDPHVRYTTAEFDIDPSAMAKACDRSFDGMTWIFGNFPDKRLDGRFFSVFCAERNKLLVVAGSCDGTGRVRNVQDIREFAASLRMRTPFPTWFWRLLEYLESGPGTRGTYADCVVPPMHHVKYDKIGGLPRNFVALGDAVMRTNPFHGQGWSKCMNGALILSSLLLDTPASGLPYDFSKRYFRLHARKLGHLWSSTKAVDYIQPTTTPAQGETRDVGWWDGWFGREVSLLAKTDPEIATRFWHVAMWLAPPTHLLAPSVLARVAWNWLTVTRHLEVEIN